jgi:hypothetical protein
LTVDGEVFDPIGDGALSGPVPTESSHGIASITWR